MKTKIYIYFEYFLLFMFLATFISTIFLDEILNIFTDYMPPTTPTPPLINEINPLSKNSNMLLLYMFDTDNPNPYISDVIYRLEKKNMYYHPSWEANYSIHKICQFEDFKDTNRDLDWFLNYKVHKIYQPWEFEEFEDVDYIGIILSNLL